MSTEPIIEMISELEGNESRNLCEIRFDALVTMYSTGYIKQKRNIFSIVPPKPGKPKWFKCRNMLTMEAIRYSDEYQLGRFLKDMLAQLEEHIEKQGFETNNL